MRIKRVASGSIMVVLLLLLLVLVGFSDSLQSSSFTHFDPDAPATTHQVNTPGDVVMITPEREHTPHFPSDQRLEIPDVAGVFVPSESAGPYAELGLEYYRGMSRQVAFTANGTYYTFPMSFDQSVAIYVSFLNATYVDPQGLDEQQTRYSFFHGNERRSELTYGSIIYENLWSGIDLIYYGISDGLKYEYHIHPGADPSQISFLLSGADFLTISDSDLVLHTPLGELRDAGLCAFEEEGGREVGVAFSLQGDIVGFDVLEPYVGTLVIDPILYSTYVGGPDSAEEEGRAVAVANNSDAAYVTGTTTGTDFPVTSGVFDPTAAGDREAWVAKFVVDGSYYEYASFIGGSNNEYAKGIAVDSTGAAYCTGYTQSNDFPTVQGSYDQSYGGGDDGYVVKVSPDGTSMIYSTYLGHTEGDIANDITISSVGDAYIVGRTLSTSFPVTSGAMNETYGGHTEGWLLILDANGSGVEYCTFIGGDGPDNWDEFALGVAIDDDLDVYVTGGTRSFNFPTTTGAFDETHNGNQDAFLVKISPDGGGINDLIFGTYLGGSEDDGNDEAGVVVAPDGAAYVAGVTASSNFPVVQGSYDQSHGGSCDAFVLKVSSDGSSLEYSTYLGAAGDDRAWDVSLDDHNRVIFTGWAADGFPTAHSTANDTTHNGGEDAYIAMLDPNGSLLVYSSFLGGAGNDRGIGCVSASDNVAYVTGMTQSLDFPVSSGANDTLCNGTQDAFLTKFQLPDVDHNTTLCVISLTSAFASNDTVILNYTDTTDAVLLTSADQVYVNGTLWYLDVDYSVTATNFTITLPTGMLPVISLAFNITFVRLGYFSALYWLNYSIQRAELNVTCFLNEEDSDWEVIRGVVVSVRASRDLPAQSGGVMIFFWDGTEFGRDTSNYYESELDTKGLGGRVMNITAYWDGENYTGSAMHWLTVNDPAIPAGKAHHTRPSDSQPAGRYPDHMDVVPPPEQPRRTWWDVYHWHIIFLLFCAALFPIGYGILRVKKVGKRWSVSLSCLPLVLVLIWSVAAPAQIYAIGTTIEWVAVRLLEIFTSW